MPVKKNGKFCFICRKKFATHMNLIKMRPKFDDFKKTGLILYEQILRLFPFSRVQLQTSSEIYSCCNVSVEVIL